MTLREFRLPDLGEGLTESEIVEWHVAVGDRVALNQTIADVETAKAVVQLPSPFAGVVAALHVEPGTTVEVGAPILSIEVEVEVEAVDRAGEHVAGPEGGPAAEPAAERTAEPAAEPAAERTAEPAAEPAAERTAVLVGYGPAVETGRRPRRKPRTLPAHTPPAHTGGRPADRPGFRSAGRFADEPIGRTAGAGEATEAQAGAADGGPRASSAAGRGAALATPPVRKLAHDLGVDLEQLVGTGEGGVVTRSDVTAAAERGSAATPDSPPTAGAGAPAASARRSSDAPAETRTPIRGVRKATAAAMVQSAFSAPHVTEFLTVDVTESGALVGRLKAAGRSATMLALVAKALCIAVERNPTLNSRWDEGASEIVQYRDVGLGIAVATPRGLMVPTIQRAQTMTVPELAEAIRALAETARAGRSTPAQLSGGTITITNIGVFGVDAGTPILNPGEAAILAMGAVRRQPWEHAGGIALRELMTLSLSFDHRLVDGEQGARFLTDIGGLLRDPASVLALV